MQRYFVYADDADGIYGYKSVYVIDSDLELPQVLENIEKAGQEYFDLHGASPNGDKERMDWAEIVDVDKEICRKYGFDIDFLTFDHIENPYRALAYNTTADPED